jgi:hypothetical protein
LVGIRHGQLFDGSVVVEKRRNVGVGNARDFQKRALWCDGRQFQATSLFSVPPQ